jgi:hypothetical protein
VALRITKILSRLYNSGAIVYLRGPLNHQSLGSGLKIYS